MFFRTDRDPDGLYDENRLLRLLLRAFGLRSSDPDTIGQLIRAMVPEHGPFPPCEKGAVPDGRIRPAEKAARFRMPEKYIYPYTPKCSVAWAWERSWDVEGMWSPEPPCMGPCWDGWCTSCTFCKGGQDLENIWDVMEDMSVRIAHLTAEVFRLSCRLYEEEYPCEAHDPASSLYDDLFFTTETCFPAYREMLRCRSHGQDLMDSDEYRQSVWDMVREGRDDGRYGIMQFLEWRKRRFSMHQTGPLFVPSEDVSPEYTDDMLWEDLVRTFPEVYS